MYPKTLLLFALILGSTFISVAQKDYALTPKGDTLTGKLKMSSIDNLDHLLINSNGKKTNYSALQIKGFQKDGITYQSVKYDNAYRFMKVIKSGYLSLYAFSASGQNTWDGRFLQKKDGSGMDVPNLAFKKFLSKYLGDCSSVKDNIEKGKLAKRDIEQIVDLYNTCIQSKTNAVVKTKEALSLEKEKSLALKQFSEKVEAENFITKKDVTDLLKDIQGKVSRNEAIPGYLTEGLRSYLTDTPALLKEAEELIVLLKK